MHTIKYTILSYFPFNDYNAIFIAFVTDHNDIIMIPLGDDKLPGPVKRQASNNNNQDGSDLGVVIGVSVGIIGGYFLILFLLLATLIFCFVHFNCQPEECTCNPKCSRKLRLRCPKNVEDNVCYCCGAVVKLC